MVSITPSLSNLPESITSPIFFTTLKGHLFNTVMAMATGKDDNIEVWEMVLTEWILSGIFETLRRDCGLLSFATDSIHLFAFIVGISPLIWRRTGPVHQKEKERGKRPIN